MSANYIYTEGKRLEALAFRLLDIIVAKRDEVQMQEVSTEDIFAYLQDMFADGRSMVFYFDYDKDVVLAETNLIKTVLVNLIDNACKASEPGSEIDVYGYTVEGDIALESKITGLAYQSRNSIKLQKHFIWWINPVQEAKMERG